MHTLFQETAAQKLAHDFLIMSYSAFAAILWQILKSHFERKQSKTDYPKNIWKEEKSVDAFFWVLVICISVRKNYRKPQMCWCRSSSCRKPSSLLSSLTLIFSILGEHEKGAKYISKVLEHIAKILKVLKAWK